MQIVSVGKAHPEHWVDQESLIVAFERQWGVAHQNIRRVRQLHEAVQVGGRHLALPMDEYENLSFGAANDAFIRVGLDVAEKAIHDALANTGFAVSDVDAIWFTTVTGISAPSLDARLMNRLPFRSDLKRTPLFGLGCVAGAAGVARVADYLKGHPDGVCLLVSVELCSLTLQKQDLSIANLISSGLFGDGAAAVLMVGANRVDEVHPSCAGNRADVVASRSRFYPNTEGVMGWDVGEKGFRVVLSADVPKMVTDHIADDVAAFLDEQACSLSDIRSWVCHPGGPRVLSAMQEALNLSKEDLALTWESLRRVGNMSSTSVLHVLKDTMVDRPPGSGTFGMMMAMGPAFCSELVLLRWR